ncbi:alpha-E domain-containing protein [Rubellimicrobium roseum]|uniref:Alpha-E domain-containing protein n=1 Tax=Rubellimicrobium roseum TaxID=687525 RepID=A0A5C4NEY6_9RHOB|nr:alpha-E domain-containing protein [Rubellimicrobium roseum]TNC73334.1 alpha-E domain-containing protein [Rubellimicrobium roseum]
MLGKTAGGLYWMFRYLERSENTARFVAAGQRIALTRSHADDEWTGVLQTTATWDAYRAKHGEVTQDEAVHWMLCDRDNSSSVLRVVEAARNNARLVRTALTREVWESVNESWMILKEALSQRVSERDLPQVLTLVRQRSAHVRGAFAGTMLRNDIYNFARLGTFIERADNTARLVDVKSYVLLPSSQAVGSSLDNVQWETLLRSVSAEGAYRMTYGQDVRARNIAQFLLLDRRMPRSLAFSVGKLVDNFHFLSDSYGTRPPSAAQAQALHDDLLSSGIDEILDRGLHDYIQDVLRGVAAVGSQTEVDYRFYA